MTLLPCPFCNSTPLRPPEPDFACVECLQCGAFGPDADTPTDATDRWNHRTPEPSHD